MMGLAVEQPHPILGKSTYHITLPRRAQWKVLKIINKHHILFINLVKIFKDLPSFIAKPQFVCCVRCSMQSNCLNSKQFFFNFSFFSPNQGGPILFSGKSRSRFYGWTESRALKVKQTVVKNYLWQIL